MSRRKIESVFQKDSCGCWIAVASMLSGVDYDRLKSPFTFRDGVTGRSAKPLLELLSKHGVEVEAKCTRISPARPLENLQVDALVYGKAFFREGAGNRFKITKKSPGHWLVWDAHERVLRDPAGFNGDMLIEARNFRKVLSRP